MKENDSPNEVAILADRIKENIHQVNKCFSNKQFLLNTYLFNREFQSTQSIKLEPNR